MPKKRRRTQGMTDAELAAKGRSHKEAQEQEKLWKDIKDGISREIIAEMDARGTHGIETHGVKITDTHQKRTIYSYHGLASVLSQKMMNKIRPEVVDVGALARLVQAGKVPAEVVAEYAEVVTHARYPTVTYTEE